VKSPSKISTARGQSLRRETHHECDTSPWVTGFVAATADDDDDREPEEKQIRKWCHASHWRLGDGIAAPPKR